MCTKLENDVLRNGQQLGSAENSFFDYSKFEAMKSLSGWEAAHSDKDQFRANIKVSGEQFLSYRCLNKSRNEEMKNGIFAIAHFCI